MPYTTRLMRAISTMARREGKEMALNFFDLQKPADVSYRKRLKYSIHSENGYLNFVCMFVCV